MIKTRFFISMCASLLAATCVLGCESEPEDTADDVAAPDDEEDQNDVEAPPFPEGTGQQARVELEYPAGPFGYAKGSIIENFRFVGFANSMVQRDELQPLELAMFYNPTGDGVYPEGSPFGAGNPKPKALLIDIASVWCGPCNYEADVILPGEYAKYKPMGGEFLLQLADGPTVGKPARIGNLKSWTTKYAVNYPATLDPSYKLGPLFEAEAYPQNMIIDTRTMKIVEVLAGAPEPGGTFWKKFENLLEK